MNEVTTNKETVLIEKKQKTYINRYNKVIEKANKTAWELAKVVYDTINADDFKEVFGTQKNYSKMLNVSDSAITKLSRAYERRKLLIEIDNDFESMGCSNVQELAVLECDRIGEFVELESVLPSDTVKELREKVKHFTEETEETEESEETEETEESEESEELIVVYNGAEYQILNVEMIAKIKELLEIE